MSGKRAGVLFSEASINGKCSNASFTLNTPQPILRSREKGSDTMQLNQRWTGLDGDVQAAWN